MRKKCRWAGSSNSNDRWFRRTSSFLLVHDRSSPRVWNSEFCLFILSSSASPTTFFWMTSVPSEKKDCVFWALQEKKSHCRCDSQELNATSSNQLGVTPLSSKQWRSHSQGGQASGLRVAVFSAQIPITVTVLSPNNVLLLLRIPPQVVNGSWLHLGRTSQRRPDDEKMTEYQALTAQLGVMYTVCAHQGRSPSWLATHPAVSWQVWINWEGKRNTSPLGSGPPRGMRVHRAVAQGSFCGIIF